MEYLSMGTEYLSRRQVYPRILCLGGGGDKN